jgi:hypothetical protein
MADQSLLVSWKAFITATGFVNHWEAYGMLSQYVVLMVGFLYGFSQSVHVIALK